MSLTAGKQLLLSSPAGGYQVSRSLRFNAGDTAYLSRTVTTAGNRRTFTLSFWVKRTAFSGGTGPGDHSSLFWAGDGNSNNTFFNVAFLASSSGAGLNIGFSTFGYSTSATFRDSSAWYHFVIAVDTTQSVNADKIKVYQNGILIAQPADNSLTTNLETAVNGTTGTHTIGRASFTGATGNIYYLNAYLAEYHLIDGLALDPSSFGKTDAITGQWIPKLYTGSYGTNGFKLTFSDNSNNTATTLGKDTSGNGNNWTPNNFSVSGTNYTALLSPSTTDKKLFDGSTSTNFGFLTSQTYTITFPAPIAFTSLEAWSNEGNSNAVRVTVNGTSITDIGGSNWDSLSGTSPLSSLSFTGGPGGSGGVSISAIRINGAPLVDASDNDNDSLVDTPTSYGTDTGAGGEVRGNYATWNPLDKGSSMTLTNGNLDVSTASTWNTVRATFGLTSGKWYWEYTMTAAGLTMVGIVSTVIGGYTGDSSSGYAFYSLNGNKYNAGATAYGSSFTTNDVIGVAFDADAGKIWYAKNGTWQASGNPAAGTNAAFSSIASRTYFPAISQDNTDGVTGGVLNAGQRPFAYTAPSGFKALCDTNLTAPVIAKPNTAVDVALWTGNNTSGRSITGLNFSPDFVWIKSRSNNGSHALFDVLRSTNMLASNDTGAESSFGTPPIGGYVSSFNSNGFTLTNGSTNNTYVNENTYTYVGWCWDAGSTTSTNNSGSIQSTVRVNATAGFSIVTYTNTGGAPTVGHGLGVAPKVVLQKTRNDTVNWIWYTTVIDGSLDYLVLNSTAAKTDSGAAAPTSTVFTSLATAADYVAYCFAPVAGYSSFGTYTGNLSTNGPFVYTGFRPAVVLIKSSSNAENWIILDNKRLGYNVDNQLLYPNLSNSESGADALDLLSNGFKIRLDDNVCNGSGYTYLWAAWAENPFAYARAR